ncbi:MAG: acetate--CoA ligase family protein, partial [Actinomycetes bacterium]
PAAIDSLAREGGDIVIVSQDQQATAGEYERQLGLDLAQYLADATRARDTVPVMLSPTSQDPDPRLSAFCRDNDIPLLRGARGALRALGSLAHRTPPEPVVTRAPARVAAITDAAELTEDVALEILGACGVQTPRQERVRTPDQAAATAAGFGGPVVIKAVADGLLHKSDLGLVVTDVVGQEAALGAARQVLDAASTAGLDVELLVVEQITGSLDVVVGYKRDPQFGPTTIVGLGGVWAELLDSVSVHVGALDLHAAHRLLGGSHVGRMMREARGGALDLEAVARALVAVSDLGLAHPEIVAIDINPIIVGRDRAVAVDAVIERVHAPDPESITHDSTIPAHAVNQGATP